MQFFSLLAATPLILAHDDLPTAPPFPVGDQIFTETQKEAIFGEHNGVGASALSRQIYKWEYNKSVGGYLIPYYVSNTYSSSMLSTLLPNLKWVAGELKQLGIIVDNCESQLGCHEKYGERNGHIKIVNKSCSSSLGNMGQWLPLGEQEMGIGLCWSSRGTILHEFMHALGFIHEHQRFDRDSKIDIPTYESEDPNKPWTGMGYDTYNEWNTNCGIYNNGAVETSGTKYDTGSIMHYSEGVCGLKFKNPNDRYNDRDSEFSDLDKQEICTQYPPMDDESCRFNREIVVPSTAPEPVVDCAFDTDYQGCDFTGSIGTGGAVSASFCQQLCKETISYDGHTQCNLWTWVSETGKCYMKAIEYCPKGELSTSTKENTVSGDLTCNANPSGETISPEPVGPVKVIDCAFDTFYNGCDLRSHGWYVFTPSALSCQENCQNKDGCNIWTWNSGSKGCYLKKIEYCAKGELSIRRDYHKISDSGDLTCNAIPLEDRPATTTTAPLYVTFSTDAKYCAVDTDYYGCDLPLPMGNKMCSSALKCQIKCHEHGKCNMWTWNRDHNVCYMKSIERCLNGELVVKKNTDTIAGDLFCNANDDNNDDKEEITEPRIPTIATPTTKPSTVTYSTETEIAELKNCLVNKSYVGCDLYWTTGYVRAPSALACQQKCKDHGECQFWSFWPSWAKGCFLKSIEKCSNSKVTVVEKNSVSGNLSCKLED